MLPRWGSIKTDILGLAHIRTHTHTHTCNIMQGNAREAIIMQ